MNVWCIHGNLQRPSVWDCFDKRFNREGTPVRLIKEDLHDQDLISYAAWVDGFHDRVKREKTPGPNLLLGYSLGGRLALHALLKEPTLWRGAIIIGADAGSLSEGDQTIQLERDHRCGSGGASGGGNHETICPAWPSGDSVDVARLAGCGRQPHA